MNHITTNYLEENIKEKAIFDFQKRLLDYWLV